VIIHNKKKKQKQKEKKSLGLPAQLSPTRLGKVTRLITIESNTLDSVENQLSFFFFFLSQSWFRTSLEDIDSVKSNSIPSSFSLPFLSHFLVWHNLIYYLWIVFTMKNLFRTSSKSLKSVRPSSTLSSLSLFFFGSV
jgi:hypothetical protein